MKKKGIFYIQGTQLSMATFTTRISKQIISQPTIIRFSKSRSHSSQEIIKNTVLFLLLTSPGYFGCNMTQKLTQSCQKRFPTRSGTQNTMQLYLLSSHIYALLHEKHYCKCSSKWFSNKYLSISYSNVEQNQATWRNSNINKSNSSMRPFSHFVRHDLPKYTQIHPVYSLNDRNKCSNE